MNHGMKTEKLEQLREEGSWILDVLGLKKIYISNKKTIILLSILSPYIVILR